MVEQGISNAQVVGSSPIDGIGQVSDIYNLEVQLKIMATRKKSDSGAYMSQYDTEVEKRLQALESHTHDAPSFDAATVEDIKKSIFENGISSDKVSEIDSKLSWILDVINRELNRDYYEETKG